MPDEISKALAGAKAALSSANKFTASAGDTNPSRFAPKQVSVSLPAAKPVAAPSGMTKDAADIAGGLKARGEAAQQLGSMKKGGTIEKTGLYKMHKGEEVVSADKSNLQEILDRATEGLGKPKRPKHGMRSTHVNHHTDGSHTVSHSPYDGDETSYAVKDTNELSDKMKEYLGGDEAAEGDSKKDSPSEESAEKV